MEATTSHGPLTLALAKHCHECGVCAKAERSPQSLFGRFMRWHHGWCPAWAARRKVYGTGSSAGSTRREE